MTRLTLVITILLTSFINAAAQKNDSNFTSENDKIIWQKVFDTELDFEQLKEKIIESGILESFDIKESSITGQTRLIEPDYRGAGYSTMGTPIYISRSFINAFCVIDFREGRYRVTIRNIMLSQKSTDNLSLHGEKSTIELYGIIGGKNEMKSAFLKSPAKILNYTFTKEFTFHISEDDDDW